MKVTIIIPPSPFLADQNVFPRLGPLYVAAMLEENGHEVRVADMVTSEWIPEQTDLIAISCTTPDFPFAVKALKDFRKAGSDTPIIVGGPHPTVDPETCKHSGFDIVVVGEADISDLWAQKALNGQKGIVEEPLITDLDKIPFPARHLIDLKSYHYEIDGHEATTMMTQRGCPYKCKFCCGRKSKYYNKPRYRSVENVMVEVGLLHDDGYEAIMFFDDEFNLDKKRTLRLCRALSNTGMKFRGFIRAERFSREIAQAMKQAGFVEVGCGVESGSQSVLSMVNKGSIDSKTHAREIAKQEGLRFKAFLIFGLPGETFRTIMETRDWLVENRPDDFDITIFQPYPGSPLYEELGIYIDFSKEAVFYKGVPGEYKPLWVPAAFKHSPQELADWRDTIDKDVREKLDLPEVRRVG